MASPRSVVLGRTVRTSTSLSIRLSALMLMVCGVAKADTGTLQVTYPMVLTCTKSPRPSEWSMLNSPSRPVMTPVTIAESGRGRSDTVANSMGRPVVDHAPVQCLGGQSKHMSHEAQRNC